MQVSSDAEAKPAMENENREESRYLMVTSSWDMEKGEFVDSTKEIKDDTAYGPEPKSHLAFTFRKRHTDHPTEQGSPPQIVSLVPRSTFIFQPCNSCLATSPPNGGGERR